MSSGKKKTNKIENDYENQHFCKTDSSKATRGIQQYTFLFLNRNAVSQLCCAAANFVVHREPNI
jgi:hypothetical protein